MTDISRYLATFFAVEGYQRLNLPEGHHRRAVLVSKIRDVLSASYSEYRDSLSEELDNLSIYIFDQLFAQKVIKELNDNYAGSYFAVAEGSPSRFRSALVDGEVISKFASVGPQYKSDVISAYLKKKSNESISTAVPASNRLVQLNDNNPEVRSLREMASEFADHLSSANDVGSLSDDEKNVAAYESFQLADLLSQDVVQLSTVEGRAKKLLTWVSQEAMGALIGTAALALLAAIASFFGFSV